MQILITLRSHLTSVIMAKVKTDNKCWRGGEDKVTSLTVGGPANYYGHSGNQCGEFSKN